MAVFCMGHPSPWRVVRLPRQPFQEEDACPSEKHNNYFYLLLVLEVERLDENGEAAIETDHHQLWWVATSMIMRNNNSC